MYTAMRRILFLLPCFLLLSLIVMGQKPVPLQTMSLFQGKQPETISIFNAGSEAKDDISQYVERAFSFTLKQDIFHQLNTKRPGLLRLQLPEPLNLALDLYQVSVFSDEARIMTSEGIHLSPDPDHIFYRGMIHGNPNSLAVVSVFEDRVQIMYSDINGNKRIQQTRDGNYIAFEDRNILIPKQVSCFVEDSQEHVPVESIEDHPNQRMTGNCIEVYVECDYKSYQDNGSSLPNTEAWVAALWNEVITLYGNEDIPVMVSDVLVYTSSDPFAGLNSTSAVLSAFVTHMNSITYNGRLAHFMSTRGLGGGIAYINVLCSTTNMCAVSASLSTTILPFPTYSWNVEVVTHEMGHNVGSPHTHACAWNGNSTQVDDCGNVWAANNGNTPEGAACYNPGSPILPTGTGGTIMSYCHLIGNVGINFNNGFGTAPGNLIRSKYNNASCVTGTCSPPPCTFLTDPITGSVNVDINADLFWSGTAGANGYNLSIGTTTGGVDILNNLDVGLVTKYNPNAPFPFLTPIYVNILPYNDLGQPSGCQEQTFVTEGNVQPVCTHLTSPANGASNVSLSAVINWAHAVGNQSGYKITIGTTPGGAEIVNQLNVGNVNYYDPPGLLPHSSTIYVKVTPYGINGDVLGCVTESFATLIPINGDFCSLAINLPCGASLPGNTSQALADPEAFTCGTDISAPGIWYTFVGDGQNSIISTCSQYGYDIKLNAYRGSCAGLICVTGIDDYCNTGSLISFPTTNGTTYFVLVQGWSGQVGSYTLTRTCYGGPFYCATQGNSSVSEWISSFSFAGYTKSSGSSNYSDFTNETITLARGGTYPIQITPGFLQGARTENYRVWIDFNKDGDFVDSGENVYAPGASSGTVSSNITIPVTVATGTTRVRVAMRYNQVPPSCGSYDFGEVEDYSINIRCNIVTSTSDSGNGSLRNVSMCADDNENVLFASSLNNQTINVTSTIVVDGQWKWMAGAGTNIKIKAASNVTNLLSIPVGKSAEIQNLVMYSGTVPLGTVISNSGNLILRDCNLFSPTGSTSFPLQNNGTVNLFGFNGMGKCVFCP